MCKQAYVSVSDRLSVSLYLSILVCLSVSPQRERERGGGGGEVVEEYVHTSLCLCV